MFTFHYSIAAIGWRVHKIVNDRHGSWLHKNIKSQGHYFYKCLQAQSTRDSPREVLDFSQPVSSDLNCDPHQRKWRVLQTNPWTNPLIIPLGLLNLSLFLLLLLCPLFSTWPKQLLLQSVNQLPLFLWSPSWNSIN